MKKRLLVSLFVIAGSVLIGFNPAAVAAASAPVTHITGRVFAPPGDPYDVAGLRVSITCIDDDNGEYYGEGYDIADADGGYLVTLPAEDCPVGGLILGGASDDAGLHYGRGRNFTGNAITSKLNLYTGDIGMWW